MEAIKPKHIIPNHTFHPELYKELFGDINVLEIKDGQTIEL
ncbi:hypothetical protein D1BOALGB6SA_6940 [Olavius sp. associated proteobacterium Delta 1]|nr:hypothetical protein D1BOALGB6SA_6940 [Olavius sp. associated proteobacterium Delta 1]